MVTKAKAAEPLRKITVAAVLGGAPADDEKLFAEIIESKKVIQLVDIVGVVGKMKPGSSDYGEFVKFQGQFEATNLRTGDVYRSATCILPKFLEDDLAGAYVTLGGKGEDTEPKQAEFAVRIGVKYDKDSVTKYIYVADSLIPPAESNALLALKNRVAEVAKLPAPK